MVVPPWPDASAVIEAARTALRDGADAPVGHPVLGLIARLVVQYRDAADAAVRDGSPPVILRCAQPDPGPVTTIGHSELQVVADIDGAAAAAGIAGRPGILAARVAYFVVHAAPGCANALVTAARAYDTCLSRTTDVIVPA